MGSIPIGYMRKMYPAKKGIIHAGNNRRIHAQMHGSLFHLFGGHKEGRVLLFINTEGTIAFDDDARMIYSIIKDMIPCLVIRIPSKEYGLVFSIRINFKSIPAPIANQVLAEIHESLGRVSAIVPIPDTKACFICGAMFT